MNVAIHNYLSVQKQDKIFAKMLNLKSANTNELINAYVKIEQVKMKTMEISTTACFSMILFDEKLVYYFSESLLI